MGYFKGENIMKCLYLHDSDKQVFNVNERFCLISRSMLKITCTTENNCCDLFEEDIFGE